MEAMFITRSQHYVLLVSKSFICKSHNYHNYCKIIMSNVISFERNHEKYVRHYVCREVCVKLLVCDQNCVRIVNNIISFFSFLFL